VLLRIKASTTLDEHKVGSSFVGEQPFANPRQLLSQCIDPPQISSLHDAFLELLQVEALVLPETASAELVEISRGFLTTGPPMAKSKASKGNSAGNVVNTDSLDMLLSYCTVTTSGNLLSQLPVGIYHGKTVTTAARLGPKFVPAALVAAAIMSAKSPFVLVNPKLPNCPRLAIGVSAGKMHTDRGNLCDITAIIRLLCLCISKLHTLGSVQFHDFCDKHGLLSACVPFILDYFIRSRGLSQVSTRCACSG
jgi:hypothetical protein